MTREFGKAPGDPGTLASQERPGRPGEIPEGNNPEDLLCHPVLGLVSCIVQLIMQHGRESPPGEFRSAIRRLHV